MKQSIVHFSLVVRDYDEAIDFIQRSLHFELEDTYQSEQVPYGMIAVFKELYGNLWDLLQLNEDHFISKRMC